MSRNNLVHSIPYRLGQRLLPLVGVFLGLGAVLILGNYCYVYGLTASVNPTDEPFWRGLAVSLAIALALGLVIVIVLSFTLFQRLNQQLQWLVQSLQAFETGPKDSLPSLALMTPPVLPTIARLADACQRIVGQLQQRERFMESSEAMYHLIFDLASIGMAVMGLEGRYLRVNQALCKTLGYSEAELLEMTHQAVTYPEDLAVSTALINKLLTEGLPYAQIKKRYVAKDGHIVHVLLKVALMYDSRNHPLSFLIQVVDLTRHKLAEMALQRAEERYQVLFENATEGIFQMTREGYFISANPALASMLGYDSPEKLITSLIDVGRQLYVDSECWQEFLQGMDSEGELLDFKARVYRQDGEAVWILQSVHSVQDGAGNFLYYEGTVENITARQQAEEQILHSVLYDSLTGLPNRVLFTKRLKETFSSIVGLAVAGEWEGESQCSFAVLLLDLDRFKVVNDSLGPVVGDQLLVQISDRLKFCLQEGDTLARLGGDEFAILLPQLSHLDQALETAQRIHTSLHQPFQFQNQEFFISASIGIAPFADLVTGMKYTSVEDLLRDAEVAMYHAKRSGRACSEVYNRNLHANPWTQLQLETALRRSLERQELQLVYQPIVIVPAGQVVGFEALVRWHHPEWGIISPAEFIPVAEEAGLIVSLGQWVLRQACQQLRVWQLAGLADLSVKMAVNVSGYQLSHPEIVTQIQAILEETGVAPQCLRVEITESVLIGDEEVVTQRLAQLKALGINLCIDDFGTGYSSFSRLHRFPIDALKIDRSFVIPSGLHHGNWEIIRTIVNLTEDLGIGAIAEGVETLEQLHQIQRTGCALIQGYYFSAPVDQEQAMRLLQQGCFEPRERLAQEVS